MTTDTKIDMAAKTNFDGEGSAKVATDYLFCRNRTNKWFIRDPTCLRDNKPCTLDRCETPEPRRMGE